MMSKRHERITISLANTCDLIGVYSNKGVCCSHSIQSWISSTYVDESTKLWIQQGSQSPCQWEETDKEEEDDWSEVQSFSSLEEDEEDEDDEDDEDDKEVKRSVQGIVLLLLIAIVYPTVLTLRSSQQCFLLAA
jgi:hypothetical protein